ncbi:rubrerythrin [Mailhella massiliensis]|uniref:Rubrerythrin family protein n=1 Tax=Mailhella massiliensis TaxID=1903261 RepID=A0A921AUT1_9BACT|nr:rubrerythrin family protein [Mailhella massiliensis]HJD96533.1 rubrerythrin family protein [Mailhella massiliensis]
MKSLKGTQTEKNILTAFAGESQARNRYTYFASQAKKDGYVEMQKAFEEIANQEKEHAKRLFKFLEGGNVEITASFPAGVIGATLDNLKAAAAGENEEHSDMYPSFAKVADEEGFPVIAAVMRNIAVAEQHHEQRFLAFAAAIEAGTVFKSDKPRVWRCQNCGYVHEGLEAPESCPACAHPREYFQAL